DAEQLVIAYALLRALTHLNGEVHILRVEAHWTRGCRSLHIDLRMACMEPPQPGHKPLDRHCRKQPDAQRRWSVSAAQQSRRLVHLIKGGADRLSVLCSLGGQFHFAVMAMKQLEPEMGFELRHMPTDRPLRHVQFARRESEV